MSVEIIKEKYKNQLKSVRSNVVEQLIEGLEQVSGPAKQDGLAEDLQNTLFGDLNEDALVEIIVENVVSDMSEEELKAYLDFVCNPHFDRINVVLMSAGDILSEVFGKQLEQVLAQEDKLKIIEDKYWGD